MGNFIVDFGFVIFSCRNQAGSGFLLVDPVLRVGKDDRVLKLDSISCQTHLAKSLGDFSTWKIRLEVAQKAGYNMVHFTPIQVTRSNSLIHCHWT